MTGTLWIDMEGTERFDHANRSGFDIHHAAALGLA